MRMLRSLVFCGLALFAGAALLHAPASAAMPIDAGYQISAYQDLDPAPLAYINVRPAHDDAIIVEKHSDARLLASRSIELSKPEYLASYDTHGLSLVEGRWRC